MKKKSNINISMSYALTSLALVTMLTTGAILMSSKVAADTSVVDTTTITVPTACSMSGTGMTSHTATLQPGTYSAASGSEYENGIGTTTLTTFCNDYNGFSIYAIGYTGDSYGDNTLVGATTGLTIATKAYESTDTTSNWSMKVNKVDNATAYNPSYMSIDNSYGSWHAVPSEYTRVAHFKATTDNTSSATDTTLGGKVTTTYAAFVSSTQAADTYTGQVKYVMVHPYSSANPDPYKPTTTIVMQNLNSSLCTTSAPTTVVDSRDGEEYLVQRLADGNCWLLDNLRLDLTNSTVLNALTASNTNASATDLDYLKNGGGTTSDQYATAGISGNWTSGKSYSVPMADSTNKNTTTTSYGLGSGKIGVYYNYCAASAGTYCWGNGEWVGPESPSSDPKPDTGYDIDGDICPAGWRIPTGGPIDTGTVAEGEYQSLANAITGGTSSSLSGDSAAAFKTALSTPLSGYFWDGSASGQGSNGRFWSSTFYEDAGLYRLYVSSSGVYPQNNSDRSDGNSVRCILQ